MPSPFVPNPLPLPLFNRLGTVTAYSIPFDFKRRLGTAPSDDNEEKFVSVSQAFSFDYQAAKKRELLLNVSNSIQVKQVDLHAIWDEVAQNSGCYRATTIGMYDLANCSSESVTVAPDIEGEFDSYSSVILALSHCDTQGYMGGAQVTECSGTAMSLGNDIKACVNATTGAVTAYEEALYTTYESGRYVTGCAVSLYAILCKLPSLQMAA